jgi:hypothetical protein
MPEEEVVPVREIDASRIRAPVVDCGKSVRGPDALRAKEVTIRRYEVRLTATMLVNRPWFAAELR